MTPEELRIGNYYHRGDGFCRVTSVSEDRVVGVRLDNSTQHFKKIGVYPIELTEEWLERFGFIHRGGDSALYDLLDGNFIVIVLDVSRRPNYTFPIIRSVENGDFKYVHQLQNLFRCLTGKELTIKP